jgi:hypothetical protein
MGGLITLVEFPLVELGNGCTYTLPPEDVSGLPLAISERLGWPGRGFELLWLPPMRQLGPWCERCGVLAGSFHVCWNGTVKCELCGDLVAVVCREFIRRPVDHDCRALAPFLAEAGRFG